MGHRFSEDIDLFTDAPYGSMNFKAFDTFFKTKYPFMETNHVLIDGMGRSYQVGKSEEEKVKVDLFYTDNFMGEYLLVDNIRLSTTEEIVAMKLDVLMRIGRKKDFWDIHELTSLFTFHQMLAFHLERYPYTHDAKLIKANFTNFDYADTVPDPICLRGKHWDLIKMDLIDFVDQ